MSMPTRDRVQAFVDCVVSGDHVKAIEDFYHLDASMQENLAPLREGRDFLVDHERRALARVERMDTHLPEAILVDGDLVAIRWVFDVTSTDSATKRLIEVALQNWRDDRIQAEQFFYDSATAWHPVTPD
ncbi:nuclear transport factor 2 family protein [Nitratireductor sp. ZSWI3]|uniref:nuclear transport factor 2 family protein n=1 Tax=Nitratireductor sp. ZSWI3 TaxID=2966359 RepID=UPI00214FA53B|nr:nuclear transport factor 2 family protein [Nitratireductor sp. ZSWI3]MCR4266653.1 nuclear transport factor 2 family protein [Nitratireductor sp. ZSWI3]